MSIRNLNGASIICILCFLLLALAFPAITIFLHRPPPFDMLCLLLLALALPAIIAFWQHPNVGFRSAPRTNSTTEPHLFDDKGKLRTNLFDENGRRRTIVCSPAMRNETWRRCVFQGESCTIYAWPCHGVVIKENPDVVDIAFLGFDRFDPPTDRYPEEEQDKENEFALELLKIGGKHWNSQSRAADVGAGWKEAVGEERICRFFGWDPPDGSGGVWALEFDVDDEDAPETARLRMAVTMEERCGVLEKLGATFYKNPRECEGLKLVYAGFHPEKVT